ncbi:MAG: hypothetical protein LQ349_004886 [Xanthoria aureola]|nr:MAG: hypothetical protein LQ349_004886 [Xanthoria aureola]
MELVGTLVLEVKTVLVDRIALVGIMVLSVAATGKPFEVRLEPKIIQEGGCLSTSRCTDDLYIRLLAVEGSYATQEPSGLQEVIGVQTEVIGLPSRRHDFASCRPLEQKEVSGRGCPGDCMSSDDFRDSGDADGGGFLLGGFEPRDDAFDGLAGEIGPADSSTASKSVKGLALLYRY